MIAVPVRPQGFATVPRRVNLASHPPHPQQKSAASGAPAASSFPFSGLAAAAIAVPGRRTQRAAEIVDVEPVKPMDTPQVKAALEVVEAALSQALRNGVPVRNQVMEYKADPMRSPLANCGIPALAPAGKKAAELLIQGLVAKVDQDSAEVAAAVLCLMLGGLDEAHNLITPHSWSAPTTFGGLPKLRSTASREAKYCHVIVHRMEGENLGEFGSGFNNSNYWLGQAFYHSGGMSEHPIFPHLRRDVEDFVGDCHDARCLLRTMGPKWEPKLFNNLCEDALLTEDPELLEFCKKVQTRELQLLFEHIMTAGEESQS